LTLLIDDNLTTSLISVPLSEGWVDTSVKVEIREGLSASDVTSEDVALISAAEATLLADTHVLISEIAVVLDGVGPIAMRTPVRPDGVEETVVRLLDAGPTAEVLIRALLRPYFGISATTFARSDDDPGAETAEVVILDGAAGLLQPEAGHQSDLVRDWFVLTGQAVVSHVVVIGLHALARGAGAELETLAAAVATGLERKRDVRGIVAARWDIEDREVLGEITNRQRFELTQADRNSLANLIARGTWGARFGKRLPVYRDALPDDVRGEVEETPDD
jgi:hypothetical protein